MKEYSGVHWKPLGTIDTSGHRLLSKTETGLPGTKWETRFFHKIVNDYDAAFRASSDNPCP